MPEAKTKLTCETQASAGVVMRVYNCANVWRLEKLGD